MDFPKPRPVSLPRLSRRRKIRTTQIAAVVSVVGATVAIAVPELARAVADGRLALPEPWHTLAVILLTATGTAIAMHRTQGGHDATGK